MAVFDLTNFALEDSYRTPPAAAEPDAIEDHYHAVSDQPLPVDIYFANNGVRYA